VNLLCSYDPVVNNSVLVEELQAVCQKLGYSYLEAETAMTGEDFGFFTTLYPGLLFWLGSCCDYPLHSERFLPDDACIEVGVNTMFAMI
jgi:N-acetyldiaminopimelate deacetylase